MSSAFRGKRKMGTRERSELFRKREAKKIKFSFCDVDRTILLAALDTAIYEGATLSFAPAMGGYGVTLRVYMGETADTEFAGSVKEMDELLTMFVEGLSSKSEDVIEATRLRMQHRGPGE